MATNDNQKSNSVDRVPLLDIARENGPLQAEMQAAVTAVMESGWFVFGPDCTKLEEEMAELCGAKHAIGCASGSDALLLALMASDVGAGDEVIIPSFTFFATASAPARLGARPVFVDIDPKTFNICPEQIEAAITPATKAIIPVHLFGQCADMDAIDAIADQHGITVIEDAAQAIGAKLGQRPAGSLGSIGCFSFYPTKNLGGCGDAGMLTTSDDKIAERLKRLRNHGMEPRYYHDEIGVNSRLDAMQAAALRVKLKHLGEWTEVRRANADRYTELFTAQGIEQIALPTESEGCHHVWNQFTIRSRHGTRDELRSHLQAASVGSEIYYPVPMHRQVCFQHFNDGRQRLTETDRAAEQVLSLPIFPQITEAEQRYVVDRIADFFAAQSRSAA